LPEVHGAATRQRSIAADRDQVDAFAAIDRVERAAIGADNQLRGIAHPLDRHARQRAQTAAVVDAVGADQAIAGGIGIFAVTGIDHFDLAAE
jgi:hypothetical protein